MLGGFKILDYFRLMNNSKISISITGTGWDTLHYLEVPFMKSMLLTQHNMDAINGNMTKNPVVYIKNFLDKYSATFYNTNLDNIEELTKNAAEYMFKCLDDNNYWRSNIV